MFNRNKALSLMLAAASVATIAPSTQVMAAEKSKAEKMNEVEGTVYEAVAYKDGKAFINGDELDGKEDDGAYYYDGSKYVALEDVDSGSNLMAYGDKYIEVDEGDYYLDLSDGKVSDDTIREENFDKAASALRKQFKNNDPDKRYNEEKYKSEPAYDEDSYKMEDGSEAVYELVAIPSNKFVENDWYKVTVPAAKGYDGNHAETFGSTQGFTVYTDNAGNYVDADFNLGKIQLETKKGSATIKTTGDVENDHSVQVNHVRTIASDKDYIYRLVELKVFDKGVDVTDSEDITFKKDVKMATATTDSAIGLKGKIVNAIQKVSKAQSSDDVDDARYAKTVSTYMLANKDGYKEELYALDKYAETAGFTIADGNLISYAVQDNELRVQVVELESKNGYCYVDVSKGDSCELESSDIEDKSFDFDIDGNIYALNSGRIYRYDIKEEEFEELYRASSCKSLSVYDENNIIAWDEENDEYCVIGGSSNGTTEEEGAEGEAIVDGNIVDSNLALANKGLVLNTDGSKSFVKEDGTKATGWFQDTATNKWYFFDNNGVSKIGWVQSPESGYWYYMDKDSTMLTKQWIKDNGEWFYMSETGAVQTGWLNESNNWYYLKPSLGNQGAMLTGWIKTGGEWYYLQENGVMQTGWIRTNNKWYYCDETTGQMLKNTTIEGYELDSTGAVIEYEGTI